MKRVFCALVLAVLVGSPVFGASPSEKARMGTFISNFTEAGIYDIDIDTISMEELAHFGVRHNYINNFKSRIKRCPKKNCPYGDLIIDKKYVAESVKKYFALNLDHTSTGEENYDGKVYHFELADGERPYYADVHEVSRKGNTITMRGELYFAEDEDDRPASFTATAQPYKFNGKDTWSILTLKTQWYEN
ncbi:MAG: hypothetical protein IJS39_05205 [Synergistaceae bacterium]|nr:hypothetical protein [Synergistaceae bacterium]